MAQAIDKMILEMIMENKKVLKAINQVDKEQKSLSKKTEQNNSILKSSWLKVAGAITVVSLGIKKAFDFGKQFAQYKQGMDALARNTGLNADKIVAKLREVSAGTVSNRDLMLSANRAVALNVTKDVDKMAQLLEIARVKAKAMGITTTQAFNDIVTGIGRGSPLILDNLGIITKGWDKEAKASGKAMDTQFILNKILQQGSEELEKAGAKTFTQADAYEKMSASGKNLGLRLGKLLNEALKPVVKFINLIISGVNKLLDGLEALASRVVEPTVELGKMGIAMQSIGVAGNVTGKELLKQAEIVRELAEVYDKWSGKTDRGSESVKDLAGRMQELKSQLEVNIESGKEASKFMEIYGDATETAKQKIEELTEAEKGREDEVSPTTTQTDEAKARVEDYYSYINDQRQLNLIKEQEAYTQALAGLQLALEEKKITQEQYDLLREQAFDQHIKNLNNIDGKRMTATQKFGKEYEKAWQTAVGNTVEKYADGIADMIATGSVFKGTFVDFIKTMTQSVVKLILKMTIMKGIMSLFGGPLGFLGFAEGTNSAPGGLAVVGEKGPELMYVPPKSVIVPNNKVDWNKFNPIPRYQDGVGDISRPITQSRTIQIENLTVETQDAEALVDQLESLSENVNSPLFRR